MDIALVHGEHHGAWCWELLIPELEHLGHRAVPVDLPISDPAAGAVAYAQAVERALDALPDPDGPPVVVAHSMGGLVAPLVAAERPVRALVFVAAFLPVPGRSANDQRAAEPVDPPAVANAQWTDIGDDVWMIGPNTARELLYHDMPAELARWAIQRLRAQCHRVFAEPTPLAAWPDVPSASIVCRNDRAINPDWVRRAAHERLGTEAVEIRGGHAPFLSNPRELARLIGSLLRIP